LTTRLPGSAPSDPAAVRRLSGPGRELIEHAYAGAVHVVFFYAAPIALVAVLLAVLLPQVRMRSLAAQTATATDAGVGLPGSPDSTDQLENVVSHLLRKPGADAEVYALSGCSLDVATAWGLLQVFLHGPLVGRQARQADIEAAVGVPAGVLATFFDEIVSAGLLQRHGDEFDLTETGQEQVRRITDAYVAWLLDQLRDWLPSDTGQRQRVADALTRVAVRMVRESWRSA
jgi:hypothetical protein